MAYAGTLRGSLFRLGIAAAVTVLLAACATAPQQPVVAVIPEAVPITLPPPKSLEQVPVQIGADGSPLPTPVTTPEYTDLLERLRAGFALGDLEEPRIDKELEWFLRHPDYIERTLNRAAPYLHHIITEIEARNLPLELAVLPVGRTCA